jgi:hypothetical protein
MRSDLEDTIIYCFDIIFNFLLSKEMINIIFSSLITAGNSDDARIVDAKIN